MTLIQVKSEFACFVAAVAPLGHLRLNENRSKLS
jgi:hypothetical protein